MARTPRQKVDNPDEEDYQQMPGDRLERSSIDSYDAYSGNQFSKVQTSEPITLKQAAVRWFHRRVMAYTALISTMVVTAYLLLGSTEVDRLDALQDPIVWFYITMASIVGAYVGFATAAEMFTNKNRM